jgi:putative transposase
LTVKYRKSLLNGEVEKVILEIMRGLKERYTIDIQTVGFDKNHIHFLCRFLPTYSGGQVVKVVRER